MTDYKIVRENYMEYMDHFWNYVIKIKRRISQINN